MMISMILFMFILRGLYPHEHELDGPVLLLAAKNGQSLLPGFQRGFVDPVELEEFPVALADLVFDVAIPEVSSEAEGAVWLLVEGDVVGAFELDDEVAFGLVLVIAPGVSVLEQGQLQLLNGQPQGFDVFDLCFDFGEV